MNLLQSSDRHFQGLIDHRLVTSLLIVWERTLSVYNNMPTMNIQISLKFHAICAASKSVVKLQQFATERDIIFTWNDII